MSWSQVGILGVLWDGDRHLGDDHGLICNPLWRGIGRKFMVIVGVQDRFGM